MPAVTHWTNWSANEVANSLHVGADKVRKVLDAMADGDKLFKTWNHRTQAIVYRLPKEDDTPERNLEHREAADNKAAEVKEAKAARRAERKKVEAEYAERKAREAEELKARVAQEAEDDILAERTREKAKDHPKTKPVLVSLTTQAFTTKTIGWC